MRHLFHCEHQWHWRCGGRCTGFFFQLFECVCLSSPRLVNVGSFVVSPKLATVTPSHLSTPCWRVRSNPTDLRTHCNATDQSRVLFPRGFSNRESLLSTGPSPAVGQAEWVQAFTARSGLRRAAALRPGDGAAVSWSWAQTNEGAATEAATSAWVAFWREIDAWGGLDEHLSVRKVKTHTTPSWDFLEARRCEEKKRARCTPSWTPRMLETVDEAHRSWSGFLRPSQRC